jgi:5-methylcytosine-specific restriction endonuclease McrA
VAKPKKIKSFLLPILRRASMRWWAANQALADARVSRGVYKCAGCGELFKREQIHIDHIEPVIPVDGTFTDWNTFIERLFCPPEGFQILCIGCHESKTQLENIARDANKSIKKLDKKKKK